MWLTCPVATPGQAQDLADPVEDVGGEASAWLGVRARLRHL